jgi:hypothetical protein
MRCIPLTKKKEFPGAQKHFLSFLPSLRCRGLTSSRIIHPDYIVRKSSVLSINPETPSYALDRMIRFEWLHFTEIKTGIITILTGFSHRQDDPDIAQCNFRSPFRDHAFARIGTERSRRKK